MITHLFLLGVAETPVAGQGVEQELRDAGDLAAELVVQDVELLLVGDVEVARAIAREMLVRAGHRLFTGGVDEEPTLQPYCGTPPA